MKKLFLLGLLSVSMSACSIAGNTGDHVTLTGTPKGMMAFGDFLNGAVRTGKESPDKPSEYFAHRHTQEEHETARRAQAVGFWQRLVN